MMYQVNLLPWRQRRARRRSRLFSFTLALEMLLAGLVSGLLAFHWRSEQADLAERLGQWQRQAQWTFDQQQHVQRQIEQHRRMAHRLSFYRQSALNNQYFSRLLDQLPTLLPAGLWLTGLRQQEGTLVISGCCECYGDILSLRRRLGASELFSHVRWQGISRRNNGHFRFTFQTDWPQRRGEAGHG
ncbi:PilN domain-containing protein [Acerihabitans sp. TG2]|uniref:PilN domain-containing protein n=1 Tax=Acerihabitans sp. TG2 TaxID=3096008 RepID=UPI002B238DB3|nr:PilN domain-containing protein [Acerihabitans sp. TG2]MEA9390898.1 PilN domain-containing protein [Acerihabitans sp. TG2]